MTYEYCIDARFPEVEKSAVVGYARERMPLFLGKTAEVFMSK